MPPPARYAWDPAETSGRLRLHFAAGLRRAMRACRALVLRRDITRPPEAQQKVAGLLKIREGFRRWVSERARSNGEMQAPEQNPLKYLAQKSV